VRRLPDEQVELVDELVDRMMEIDRIAARIDALVLMLRDAGVSWHVIAWAFGQPAETVRRRFARRAG